jgi:hypothetical protein
MVVLSAVLHLLPQEFHHLIKAMCLGSKVSKWQLSSLDQCPDSVFHIASQNASVKPKHWILCALSDILHFKQFASTSSHCIEEIQFVKLSVELEAFFWYFVVAKTDSCSTQFNEEIFLFQFTC